MPEQEKRSSYFVQARRRVAALDSNVHRLSVLLYEKGHADVDKAGAPLTLALHRARQSAMNVQVLLAKLESADETHWNATRVVFEDAWEDVSDAILALMRRIANGPQTTTQIGCTAKTHDRS